MALKCLTMFANHSDTDLTKKEFMATAAVIARNAAGSCEEMIADVHKLDLMLDELYRKYGPDSAPPIPAGWKRICEEKPALDQWFVLWSPHFVKPETRQFTQENAAFNWDTYTDHIWSPVPDIPIIYAGA